MEGLRAKFPLKQICFRTSFVTCKFLWAPPFACCYWGKNVTVEDLSPESMNSTRKKVSINLCVEIYWHKLLLIVVGGAELIYFKKNSPISKKNSCIEIALQNQNGFIESPEINPYIYSQLIFNKDAKNTK